MEKRTTMLILLIVGLAMTMIGCSEDQRLAEMAKAATEPQAEQNREMARLNQEIAENNQRLIQADAETRREVLPLQNNLIERDAQGRQRLDPLQREVQASLSQEPSSLDRQHERLSMSHIVQIQTEVRDAAAIRAACRRLGFTEPVQGTTRLSSGEVSGLAVQLPGWQYPVVCDIAAGQVCYDNFGGRWGDQKQLEGFLQAYAIEKCRVEARKKGHSVTEHALSDGSIKLIVNVQGGAA